ncbi:hypothetical protein B5F77_09450 [Parabacteroides sp. An277]|uniref:DUF6383 domain-containing protein n=1 Tax=Parabacteroides sp. An277 TaxID=1965619 RepID=UPI000B3761A0|nr:DUF6383 domain-containing protein [Parabacteroides sp. An277]OUO51952.1 hypothetical protein B5F77_09450 [Parabacteroides sp. An277]
MNKKVLTLCAGALLAGGVSLAYVAPVNAALPAVTAVTAETSEDYTFEAGETTELTGDYTVKAENGVWVIDQENATLDGQGHTLKGRLHIKASGVTIKNLTIDYESAGSNRSQKTGILVGADTSEEGQAIDDVTIDNVTLEGSAKDGKLANGISINTTDEEAVFTINNCTITTNNAIVNEQNEFPVGILITGTETPISKMVTKTTINSAVAIVQKDDNGYIYAKVDADEIAGNEDLSDYLMDVLNSSTSTEGAASQIEVANATAEEVLEALENNEVSNVSAANKNAVIVASDANLLFGKAEAPSNGKPSNIVKVGSNGKVTADQASAAKLLGEQKLVAKVGDDCYLLAYQVASSGNMYVAKSDNTVEKYDGSQATDANFLWSVKMSKNAVGKIEYVFINKKTGEPLTTSNVTDGAFETVGNTEYNNGFVLELSGADLSGTNANYWGLYVSGEMGFQADYLNELEGSSFALTIKDNADGDAKLEGADAFDSSIEAEPVPATDKDATTYRFKVGDEYIVLDTEDSWSNKGVMPSGLGYKFKTISEETWAKDQAKDEPRYISTFTIYYLAGDDTDKDLNPSAKTAIERIGVTIDGEEYSLATYNSDEKYYLTVADQDDAEEVKLLADITFGGGNRADITKLLTGKFVNIQFVNKEYKLDSYGEADDNQKYKMGKLLAMQADKNGYNLKAEYIGTTKGEYPEAQWAVEYNDNNNTATFINRENPDVKVEEVALYNTDADGVYAISAVKGASSSTDIWSSNVLPEDTIKLTFVTTGMFDGFKYVNDIKALQDTVYNIAAFKAVNEVNDAYWVEKNHSTTHQIGLDGDIENAGEWNLHVAMKPQRDADGEIVKNEKDESVMVPDTVFVKSTLYTWDASKGAVPSESVLAIFPYAIQNNDNNEFVKYDDAHGREYYVADKDNKTHSTIYNEEGEWAYGVDRFALKIQPDGYHIVALNTVDRSDLVNVEEAEAFLAEQVKLYGNYDNELEANYNITTMGNKVFAGNAATRGTLDQVGNYTSVYNDVMTITPVAMPEYRPVVKANEAAFDTVRIYRDENHSQLLYEKKDQKSGISFLNIDNENQFELADAIFVDTAYVNRGTNTRWQYLLVVQPNNVSEWYCPMQEEHNTEAWREENGVDHCHDAIRKNYVEGRFLVNLMDTANVYETTTQHDNPYIHEVEAGDMKAKLAFVPGKHFGDTLVIYKDAAMTQVKDSLFLGESDFNIAKFAFRYEDNATGSFKIQTQYKEWLDGNLRAADEDWAKPTNEGYLRWVNGTLVVDEGYDKGDVFNMTENYTEGNPTANESIEANGAISVTAVDGAVVIKGAEGKNVVIATILGKVVANETVNSDNETIAVPAGIAVVSVDGESFKVVVK